MRQLIPVSNGKELYHHGILGQKWGVKNGPPYPLGVGDHNAREKKAGWRKSLGSSNGDTRKNNKKGLSEETKHKLKTAAKVAGVTAAVLIAAYAGTKIYSEIKNNNEVKAFVNEHLAESFLGNEAFSPETFSPERFTSDINSFTYNIKDIDSYKFKDMVYKINSGLHGTPEGSTNCTHCTTSFILNNVFGKNTRALGYYGVDEVSGLSRPGGRSNELYDLIFNNVGHASPKNSAYVADVIARGSRLNFSKLDWLTVNDVPPNSCGILMIYDKFTGGGHVINYMSGRTRNSIALIDAQTDEVYRSRHDIENVFNRFIVADILDFSNASLSDNAEDILQYMIDYV